MNPVLHNFFITGRLGPLFVGMQRSDVIAVLGLTKAFSPLKHSRQFFAYDSLELYFYEFKLEMTMFNFMTFPKPIIPTQLGIGELPFGRMTTPPEYCRWLTTEGIPFHQVDKPVFTDQGSQVIATDGRVAAVFDVDSQELYKIVSPL